MMISLKGDIKLDSLAHHHKNKTVVMNHVLDHIQQNQPLIIVSGK